MENILSITRKAANARITADFLVRGDNVDRFRVSYARLQRKVREGTNIVSIQVNKRGAV